MQPESTVKDFVDLPLAITCGDPSGIGPEVIAAALRKDVKRGRECILIGPARWASSLATELNISFEAVGPNDFELFRGVLRWKVRLLRWMH